LEFLKQKLEKSAYSADADGLKKII